jgi:hypothetical protein
MNNFNNDVYYISNIVPDISNIDISNIDISNIDISNGTIDISGSGLSDFSGISFPVDITPQLNNGITKIQTHDLLSCPHGTVNNFSFSSCDEAEFLGVYGDTCNDGYYASYSIGISYIINAIDISCLTPILIYEPTDIAQTYTFNDITFVYQSNIEFGSFANGTGCVYTPPIPVYVGWVTFGCCLSLFGQCVCYYPNGYAWEVIYTIPCTYNYVPRVSETVNDITLTVYGLSVTLTLTYTICNTLPLEVTTYKKLQVGTKVCFIYDFKVSNINFSFDSYQLKADGWYKGFCISNVDTILEYFFGFLGSYITSIFTNMSYVNKKILHLDY